MRPLNHAAALLGSIAAAADRSGRTFSNQTAHWLLIGRAIEESAGFDFAKVEAALVAKRDTADLTGTERIAWNAYAHDSLIGPHKSEEEFFAERRARGLGAGLDANGQIVSQSDQEPRDGEEDSG
jgi:hypothetical protein